MDDGFSPLGHYGVIGNVETCALVNRNGSIDWCCLPYVDSPSVFAAILDPEAGGHFAIHPVEDYDTEQSYIDSTNVLQTTFETDSGVVRVTDFMPVIQGDSTEEPRIRGLFRNVAVLDGTVTLAIEFVPRFDYARADTTVEDVSVGAFASSEDRQVTLHSPGDVDVGLDVDVDAGVAHAEYTVGADHDDHWFALQYSMHVPTTPAGCERLLEDTVDFWTNWVHSEAEGEGDLTGEYHDAVVRSELVLKLLYYRETGALIAAPTTSLPEDPGGVRNWDYRFSWIRDGAMTVRALTHLGHTAEARDYVHRFLERSRMDDTAQVQPLYGVEQYTTLEEETLPHLRGYRDSSPVRVGNEAIDQQQLDVYGDLVLAIYQQQWTTDGVPDKDWAVVRETAEYVCDHWNERGSGIWELRGDPQHLVHSKVMCWAALDRAIELAEREHLNGPLDRWRDCRAEIKAAVLEHGYDEEIGAFTQSFEGRSLDASGLLIPLTGFLEPDDPRIEGTIDAIIDRLATDDGLVYRYEDDDLPGEEGAFVLCSFWLVNALTISGRTEEAWDVFENVLEYASPLGLFAEQIDPETGRLLGNFPQGFSHIGLINSLLYLREAEYDWASVDHLGGPTLQQERELDR